MSERALAGESGPLPWVKLTSAFGKLQASLLYAMILKSGVKVLGQMNIIIIEKSPCCRIIKVPGTAQARRKSPEIWVAQGARRQMRCGWFEHSES